MASSDEDIIKKIAAGDARAFSELVDRHKKPAMTLAVRLLKNHHDAEEALQDAFVRAFRSLPTFEGDSTFSTWFYRILYNVCLTALGKRRKASYDSLDDDDLLQAELVSDTPSPDMQLEQAELQELTERALARLPETYGAIATLFFCSRHELRRHLDCNGLAARHGENQTLSRPHTAARRRSKTPRANGIKSQPTMNHLNAEQLFGYLDKSLDAAAMENVKAHLQLCDACRRDLELHRMISLSAKRQRLERPSARFTANVMDAVLAPAPIPAWKKAMSILRRGVIVVMIALGVVWALIQSIASSSQPSQTSSIPLLNDATSAVASLNENAARWIASLAQNALGDTTGKYLAIAAIALLALMTMDKFIIQRFLKISLR